jgi:hypothetical protein
MSAAGRTRLVLEHGPRRCCWRCCWPLDGTSAASSTRWLWPGGCSELTMRWQAGRQTSDRQADRQTDGWRRGVQADKRAGMPTSITGGQTNGFSDHYATKLCQFFLKELLRKVLLQRGCLSNGQDVRTGRCVLRPKRRSKRSSVYGAGKFVSYVPARLIDGSCSAGGGCRQTDRLLMSVPPSYRHRQTDYSCRSLSCRQAGRLLTWPT